MLKQSSMVRPGLILVIWVVLAVLAQSCAWLGPPPHAHPGDSSDQSSEHSSHKSHSTPPPDTGLMRQDSTHRWNIEFLEMAFEHSTATDSALTSPVQANESSTTHSSQDLPVFSDAPLPSLASPYANKPVRILLLEGNQSISISGTQLHIQSSNSPGIVISGTVKVSAMNNQIFMHNPAGKLITKVNHSQELRISSLGSSPSAPKPASFLQVNSKPYRGSIYFFTSPKGLQTINYVNMEDYLKGVVPHEIGTLEAWGNEALKAQAIAARTYAYKHLGTRPGQNFDLYADTRDQMYSGMHGEYPLANNAIDSTANLVLTYNNELIETYYHSTCGGMTAGLEVWGQKPKPYLLPQQDFNDSLTPWCSASRYTTWQFTWTIPQLTQIAKTFLQTARPSATFAFNHIQDIRIVQASPQGRVLVVKVYTDKGSFEMTGDRSRWLFREPDNTNKILPSNWYIIKKEGNSFIAKGRGLGHGIGMCQMGARARSRAGQSFSTILNAYYTNAQLTMIQ